MQLREHPVTDLRNGMEDAVGRALAVGPVVTRAEELEALMLAAAQWAGGENAVREVVAKSLPILSEAPLTVTIDVLKAAETHSTETASSVAEGLGGEADLLAPYARGAALVVRRRTRE